MARPSQTPPDLQPQRLNHTPAFHASSQPAHVQAAIEIREVKRTWAGSRSDVDIYEEIDRIRARFGLKSQAEEN